MYHLPLLTILLVGGILRSSAAGPSIDIRWNDLSSQFLLAENLTAEVLDKGDLVDFGEESSIILSNHETRLGRSQMFPDSNLQCSGKLENWVLRRVSVPEGALSKPIRFVVHGLGVNPRFRVGLVPASKYSPGEIYYREWMVDSDGCWVVSGIPDPSSDLDEDTIWGSYGITGWSKTREISMEVDLNGDKVKFSGNQGGSQMSWSINGFAPVADSTTTGVAEEVRLHLLLKQSLTLNGVQFDFETANFGPDLPIGAAISGNLVPAVPLNGCKRFSYELAALMKGNIVFAVRGQCDFLDKVLHAQAAGAFAVIVADNVPVSTGKGSTGKNELVIMDQFDRPNDGKKIKIPSIFVSNSAEKFITTQIEEKKRVTVVLHGAVYAPTHHGVHWKDHGLTAGIWIAPSSQVLVSIEEVEDSVNEGHIAPNQICRPLGFLPLALSERRSLLSKLEDSPNLPPYTPFRAVGDPMHAWSKRLVGKASICESDIENVSKQDQFVWLSVLQPVEYLVPWSKTIQHSGFPWFNHPSPPSKWAMQAFYPVFESEVKTGWGSHKLSQLDHVTSRLKKVNAQYSSEYSATDLDECLSFLQITELEHGQSNIRNVASVSTKGLCAASYTTIHDDQPAQVPNYGLFHSGFVSSRRYYWTFLCHGNALPGLVGVRATLHGRHSKALWAISTSGFQIIGGEPVFTEPKLSALHSKAVRWAGYVAVLLDLFAGEVTFFTDPHHTNWVTIDLQTNSLTNLQPMFPNPMQKGKTSSSKLGVRFSPFMAISAEMEISVQKFDSSFTADEVWTEKARKSLEAECVKATHVMTICTSQLVDV